MKTQKAYFDTLIFEDDTFAFFVQVGDMFQSGHTQSLATMAKYKIT